MTRQELSRLFSDAWAIFKASDISFGESLRQAWKVAKLRLKMASVEVLFAFRKVDGTIREAIGRLFDLPEARKSDTQTRKSNEEVLTYFDVDAQNWRSFKIINLL